MPIRSCPTCSHQTPRWLEASRDAFVNYYRCEACGCVWTTPKDAPDSAPRVVAEGRRPAPPAETRPTLDGDLLQTERVIRLTEASLTFAQNASGPDGSLSTDALALVENSYRNIRRLVVGAQMTPSEQARVQPALDNLRRAIEDRGGRVGD